MGIFTFNKEKSKNTSNKSEQDLNFKIDKLQKALKDNNNSLNSEQAIKALTEVLSIVHENEQQKDKKKTGIMIFVHAMKMNIVSTITQFFEEEEQKTDINILSNVESCQIAPFSAIGCMTGVVVYIRRTDKKDTILNTMNELLTTLEKDYSENPEIEKDFMYTVMKLIYKYSTCKYEDMPEDLRAAYDNGYEAYIEDKNNG